MKQLAQYQDGRLELQEVPSPMPPPGGIVVRTTCSVISPGTEKMKVEQARMSLLAKAKARPDQVRKVLDTARTLGWKAAIEKVRNRLETPTPLGYSLSGVVVAVDETNPRFRVGDRVACGGAECANHAEIVAIPDLLAAKIPDGVADWQAAYTTLCSISLEAVRQSGAALGERVLVMGQGLVGLLATSLLRAAGVRVMASDLVSSRLTTAQAMGAERVVNSAQASLEDEVHHWTDGQGVDAVMICVGGGGKGIADAAINALRDRGVVVIVGMHDAELTWKTAYLKDIQVRYSRSYGPGRYDPQYEWGGRDYPIGHVRWTENRNFEACLQLMSTGALDLNPLTTRRAEFADAVQVYQDLLQPGNTDIGVVLEYRGTGVSPVSGAAGILPASDVKEGRMPSAPATGRMPVLLDPTFIPFSEHRDVEKSQRNLPHWEQAGCTYFITFRQADAIPQEKLMLWREERDTWIRQHHRPWDDATEAAYQEQFSDRMEQWLDAGTGSCALAQPAIAKIVEGALRHFDGERYILDGFVIMPNHVHLLVKPAEGHSLASLLHSWKSFTSREIKKQLHLGEGPFWQDERFDHAIRSLDSLEAKRAYIRENPSKAKLSRGFVLGTGGTGVSPVSSAAGILPASDVHEGKMPSAPATGETPVLHSVGAGNFVRTMLLPQLQGQLPFGIISNATGLSARQAKEKFGFASATTDSAEVFSPAHSGEAVLIGTRHHLHAPMVLQALQQHQHVFVEKPLCLSLLELAEIDQAVAHSQGSVMVGFNRRFAPATSAVRSILQSLPGPKTLSYHVFAGPLAPDHWYANLEESGGRILGEGCHFLDFACHLLGETPLRVSAQAQGADSFTAQVEFSGGSSFQLIYSAEGDYGFPKETFRVFASGTVIECENFMKLTRFHHRKSTVKKFHSKGHAEEMAAWLAYLKGTAEHPLPYPEARTSMRLTFSVLQAIRERRLVEVLEPQPNP